MPHGVRYCRRADDDGRLARSRRRDRTRADDLDLEPGNVTDPGDDVSIEVERRDVARTDLNLLQQCHADSPDQIPLDLCLQLIGVHGHPHILGTAHTKDLNEARPFIDAHVGTGCDEAVLFVDGAGVSASEGAAGGQGRFLGKLACAAQTGCEALVFRIQIREAKLHRVEPAKACQFQNHPPWLSTMSVSLRLPTHITMPTSDRAAGSS